MKNTPLFFLLLFTFAAYGQQGQSFLDSRDGKKYKAVKIGNQTWMAENLNYDASGSKCYDNKPENCTKYGRLYDWETAMKACPPGWHIPSNDDYGNLMNKVGGFSTAGKHLKAKNGWEPYRGIKNLDTYGFSALHGGDGNEGYWWSANEHEYYSNYAYAQRMIYLSDYAHWSGIIKSNLQSVRCLQD
ncbi:MAG: hypothetical protein LBQ87_07600 [Candidatus Fibromonas sp.]|jgi:uncharacterized protein (TIGR02145 family)|nr:hypothetical protein [Candidatus Fibromonas sp.]